MNSKYPNQLTVQIIVIWMRNPSCQIKISSFCSILKNIWSVQPFTHVTALTGGDRRRPRWSAFLLSSRVKLKTFIETFKDQIIFKQKIMENIFLTKLSIFKLKIMEILFLTSLKPAHLSQKLKVRNFLLFYE